MYNYLTNFRPVVFGAPLQLGALSVRLVRLWVNPALVFGVDVLSGRWKVRGKKHLVNRSKTVAAAAGSAWVFLMDSFTKAV